MILPQTLKVPKLRDPESVSLGVGFPGVEAPLVAKKIGPETVTTLAQCTSHPQGHMNHQRGSSAKAGWDSASLSTTPWSLATGHTLSSEEF